MIVKITVIIRFAPAFFIAEDKPSPLHAKRERRGLF